MFCFLGSGNTVIKAVNVLQEHAVEEENIILLNLFSTPSAARTITSAFPKVKNYSCLFIFYHQEVIFFSLNRQESSH